MKNTERTIRLYRKVNLKESMEERHLTVMEGLSKLEAPLGLKDSEIPEIPNFGTELVAVYFGKNNKTKGVRIIGRYDWRVGGLNNWDDLFYEFKTTYKLIDYKKMINIDLPKVIEIYEPHSGDCYIPHTIDYIRENGGYEKTKNSFFVLQPIMYFSGEMCEELIKLSRDKIIKRLEGKVQKVVPLLDGVYIIFSDKSELPYEEFKEINDTFKLILGLI